MSIKTRTFNYGDEKESSWPPMFGTGGAGVWYRDSKTGEFKEGYPPKRETYGEGPYIIGDTIDKYYHPAAEQWVDSRGALKQLDKVTGSITTDKRLAADPSAKKERERARRKDLHESMHKAVAQIDAGTAPMTEETRAMCERQNEIVSKALNFDAFNVAGRKTNGKGKKYRRR